MAKTFLLVVVDEDRREFAVEGPMSDDTGWNRRVCAAQDTGRQVRCFTAGSLDREAASREVTAHFPWREVESIPLPPN